MPAEKHKAMPEAAEKVTQTGRETMRPDKGRLQTGEHILARLLELDFGVNVGVCKFKGDQGSLEVMSSRDMRQIDAAGYQKGVQEIIDSNIPVKKSELSREEAGMIADISRVPPSLERIRIVGIGDFDKRPCRDPHVDNTDEIGAFRILGVKRVGSDRYRLTFTVE